MSHSDLARGWHSLMLREFILLFSCENKITLPFVISFSYLFPHNEIIVGAKRVCILVKYIYIADSIAPRSKIYY